MKLPLDKTKTTLMAEARLIAMFSMNDECKMQSKADTRLFFVPEEVAVCKEEHTPEVAFSLIYKDHCSQDKGLLAVLELIFNIYKEELHRTAIYAILIY